MRLKKPYQTEPFHLLGNHKKATITAQRLGRKVEVKRLFLL
jgi:hypothetical protein